MDKKIRVRVKKAFVLPNGRKVAPGTELALLLSQAKYLLTSRKVERVSPPLDEAKAAETRADDADKSKAGETKGAKK